MKQHGIFLHGKIGFSLLEMETRNQFHIWINFYLTYWCKKEGQIGLSLLKIEIKNQMLKNPSNLHIVGNYSQCLHIDVNGPKSEQCPVDDALVGDGSPWSAGFFQYPYHLVRTFWKTFIPVPDGMLKSQYVPNAGCSQDIFIHSDQTGEEAELKKQAFMGSISSCITHP